MTTNVPLQTAFNTAQQLSGFRQNRQAETAETQRQGIINQENQALLQQRERDAQQRQAQQQQAQAIADLKAQYGETGDPEIMRQLIMADATVGADIMKSFGALDTEAQNQTMNNAASLKKMIEDNPQQAAQYWQANLANDPMFAGLADNFQSGDYEGAINEIGYGALRVGGQTVYDAMFGGGAKPFQGNAMTAQMGNILLDPAKKGTPEYDLAVSYWTAPEIVNRPDGSSVIVKKTLPDSVIQANPGLASAIDTEANSNVQSESSSTGIPADTSEQGLEITQLTEAPKAKITPEQKNYDSEFLGLMNMYDTLGVYKETLDRLGIQLSAGPLNAKDTQKLKSSYSNAMLAVKEAVELGALSGPDMGIIEQNLPDPTSLSGAFKGKSAAMEGVNAAISTVTRKAKNLNSVYGTQGVNLKEFKQSLAPLNPDALKLYKNPPAGYTQKEIDAMFVEKFGRLPEGDELK